MQQHLITATVAALATFASAAGATTYSFTTIDPNAPFLNSAPSAITDSHLIAGQWTDASDITHGFTVSGGVFTSFDAPGADNSKTGGVAGTQALGMNSAGVIVGDYVNQGILHGFVRDASGHVTSLDLAGHLETVAVGINDSGTVALQVDDGGFLNFGSFLRASDGTLTRLAFPGTLGTAVTALNDDGTTVGGYFDAANVVHGWIRNPVGVYTSLDDPNYDRIGPWGLSNSGWAVGELDVGASTQAFVRDPQGNLTAFDVPGAASTLAFDINDQGLIVGQYCEAGGTCHGFLATPAVPEPGTLALWAAGIAVVGWRARRAALR